MGQVCSRASAPTTRLRALPYSVYTSTWNVSRSRRAFEGLIDEFTIVERGRNVLTLEADAARERYQKIYARFAEEPPAFELEGAQILRRRGREIEILANGRSAEVIDRLRARSPEAVTTEALTLEEIFVTALKPEAATT
jgi:hypothetical protein